MKTFGLLGYPLSHSFSKSYFTEKFQQLSYDAQYINFEFDDISDLKNKLSEYPNLIGFNVTIPYKEKITKWIDDYDWGISNLGAINTVKIIPDNSWKGYNTDIIGFEKSILEITDLDSHQNALILGSGGASKAVQFALQKFKVPYCVISRSPDKELFELSYNECTSELIQESTLIINTTPLGMSPNIDSCPMIDYSSISSKHVCMDLVYNPAETLFLRKCKEQKALTLNGYKMLVYQADAALAIWLNDSE